METEAEKVPPLNGLNWFIPHRALAVTLLVAWVVGCDDADDSAPSTTIERWERCLDLAERLDIDVTLIIATHDLDPRGLICSFHDNRTGGLVIVTESPDGVVTTALPDEEALVDG